MNYNQVCDLDRFEKFKVILQKFTELNKLSKVLHFVIFEMENILPSLNISVFVFQSDSNQGAFIKNNQIDEKLNM